MNKPTLTLEAIRRYLEDLGEKNPDDLFFMDIDAGEPLIVRWDSEHPKPSETKLSELRDLLIEEYRIEEIHNKRRAEYPDIGDQLDALWKGGQAASDMKGIIDGIKAKYPKS